MSTTETRLPVVCDGLRLAVWSVVPENPRGVVVLLHGIPSVAPPDPDDPGYPGFAQRFVERGWAAAWGDMRAVRESPGYFSIEGWVRDARAFVDAARSLDGVSGLPVALVGSSAGGAVGAEAVRRGAPVDALVMLAAPAEWLSFAGDPKAGLERVVHDAGMPVAPETYADPEPWADEFLAVTTEAGIANVKVPILIVHGTADDVVPVDHARRLAECAPRADVRILEDAPHHLRRDPEALRIVLDWLDRILK